jgi:hypothetical protein
MGASKGPEGIFPVQVAEYALVNKIVEEPAFAYCAKHMLRKPRQSRYWNPRAQDSQGCSPDQQGTGTDFWQRVIELEM